MIEEISRELPAVFAVKDNYQIMLPVHTPCTFWVKVGEKEYFDDSNGILRSDVPVHRVTVPSKELDKEKAYTVCWRTIIERKPYFSQLKEVATETFAFHPLPDDNIKIYQLSDTHGMFEEPVASAEFYKKEKGGIDLLILNGDIADHSGDVKNFELYYRLATAITCGNIPIIASRGNHDLRGIAAEKLQDYMPGDEGKSYYSIRLGCLWALLLDGGEDKRDECSEYGGVNNCHAFRLREEDYFQKIVRNRRKEYDAVGVKHRLMLSHIPLNHKDNPPFDIEEPLYRKWVKRLNRSVRPELLLCGHIHSPAIHLPDDEFNTYGANFPVIIGSTSKRKENYYSGCGVLLTDKTAEITFNDGEKILERELLSI